MNRIQGSSHRVSVDTSSVNVVSHHSPLSELLCRPAVTIAPGATLADAVDVMVRSAVSALLVEDLGGIITERDIARALGRGVPTDERVERFATPDPIVVPGSMPVVEASAVMLNEQVRHLVVALDNGALGVVSLRDLFAVLLQAADPHVWLASLRVAIDTPSEIWLG